MLTGHTLDEFVRRHADATPDKIFWRQLSDGAATETSFGAFEKRALSFANHYNGLGLRPGRVLLIFLPQQMDGVAAFFGAIMAGLVPSFMPCPSAKQRPSVYWPAHVALMARLAPELLVTDRAHATQMRANGITGRAGILTIDAVADDARPLDGAANKSGGVALLQHSSGTTSLKKGVALSHRAILYQVQAYTRQLRMTEADNIVSWLPVYHDMGLIACTVTPLVMGQTVTCLSPFEWVARPASLFEALERYDGHFCWLPNFAFEHLIRTVPRDCRADLSRVRAFINCSEPCKAETFERFVARFRNNGVHVRSLQVCYAMAETVFAVSQTRVGAKPVTVDVDAGQLYTAGHAVAPSEGAPAMTLLSAGTPLGGMSVQIMSEGNVLPDGQVGEIVLSSKYLFDGYFRDDKTTAERLRDGRYFTRDRGFLRDGALFVLGRLDDLLIVNGRNLHAHEIETLVGAVPGLKPGRAVAFGVFNEAVGSEELVVVAERDPDAPVLGYGELERGIRALVYEQSNIEVKACRIVEPGWLVKTTSGKISRQANLAKYLSEPSFGAAGAEQEDRADRPVFERLAIVIGNVFAFPWEKIERETTADDVEGWDSLSHASLILRVENTFGIRFDDREIFGFPCVGALADRIAQLREAGGAAGAQPDRVVFKSKAASILRLGGPEAPDVIIFAGRERVPGQMDMMSFASTFANFNGGQATKYFVTDLALDWYISCFDEVVATLNRLSDRPKLLFGNSMGGYAALRFSSFLTNVVGVLAIVPRIAPIGSAMPRRRFRRPDGYQATLAPGVHYCVLYGTEGDYLSRAGFEALARGHDRTRMLIVPNCAHFLVRYLNERKLLSPIVECLVTPETMADNIERLTACIVPDWHDAAWLTQEFLKANTTRDGKLTRLQCSGGFAVAERNFDLLDRELRGYVTLEEVISRRMTLV
jgi:acyl-CoA synthetase (AMP-forming)/AMP-acid ligase II/acyl carrier protein